MSQLNKPAFPTPFSDGYGSIYQGTNPNGDMIFASDPGGLTKLELVAKDIYCALISNSATNSNIENLSNEAVARAIALLDTIEAYSKVTDKLNTNV